MQKPSAAKIASLLTRADRAFPLSVKFVVPFVVLFAVLVAAVAFVEYREQREQINNQYVHQGEIIARAMAASLELDDGHDNLNDGFHLQDHIRAVAELDPTILKVNVYLPDSEGGFTIIGIDTFTVGASAEAHDSAPLLSGESSAEETELDGETVLEVSSPVHVDGEIVAALGVYLSLADRETALAALTTRLIAGPVIAVILISGLGWLGLRLLVVKRLQLMVRSGDRLARGDMTSRVPGDWREPGHDEMAVAINHFNSMAGSIQSLTNTLELLGVTDGLTGVHNRRFFDESLAEEINRSQRNGAPVALLMLDIDLFKRYNDRFGHQAGDEALRRVAQALAREIRSVDFVARYGGEEFAVIMPGAEAPAALVVGERVRRAVESRGIPSADGGPLTVSVGVAVYPERASDGESLVAAADAAMYAAKEGGRNRVVMAGTSRAHAPAEIHRK